MGILLKIILFIVGLVSGVLWLVLSIKSKDLYDDQIEDIDPKDYYLPDIYGIGYYMIEKLNINMRTEHFNAQRKKLIQVKGEDEAEYFVYTILAGQISFFLTLLPVACLLSLIGDSFFILLFVIIIAVLLIYQLDSHVETLVQTRNENLLRDLANVQSQMALLLNAGMVLREVWHTVSESNEDVLYQEMRITDYEMNNGISFTKALNDFAVRCNTLEVKKFVSIIVQNANKGGSELALALRELSEESWIEKKQLSLQKGSKIDSALLLPTGIIFAGILLVIIVPLFTNMF